ncbi:4Fe-4S binding protein [Methylococcus mesophilus]|uniref:4Fe-4S binding protein n=1 Tax=Methylococcus mesophilus TaxID=2993564 RepID=UPI00224AAF40|nr:4Fe-4S binding protein [Methylococcus mesophilus]UZR29558.1 4Fe-4S binding protein [Methylococcus mesophilus]
MIELLSQTRCIACNICVRVCPTNVFAEIAGNLPVIARKHDCQTCFLCEAYCPVDALYVAPQAEEPVEVDETELADAALLGSYRSAIGWAKERGRGADSDLSWRLLQTMR